MTKARLVSKRQYVDYLALWVCVHCAISDRAFVQPRCPGCQQLMVKAEG